MASTLLYSRFHTCVRKKLTCYTRQKDLTPQFLTPGVICSPRNTPFDLLMFPQ
jgi:hypothetical protein